MKVFLFRSEKRGAQGRAYVYGFGPIDPDPAQGIAGSGPHAWREVLVPFGSAIVTDQATGEQLLRLAGRPRGLTAEEVAQGVVGGPGVDPGNASTA